MASQDRQPKKTIIALLEQNVSTLTKNFVAFTGAAAEGFKAIHYRPDVANGRTGKNELEILRLKDRQWYERTMAALKTLFAIHHSPSRTSLGGLFLCIYFREMKTCMFCGPTKAKITKEHVWSAWISEALKPTMQGATFTTLRYKDGKEVEHQWEAGELNLQVKDLCRPCNNDWLGRDFEGPIIKPLLADVIAHAAAARWSTEEQAQIAAWCYKMALVLEFASGKQKWFTDDERHEFRRTRAAHPFLSIRVAKYDFSAEGIFKASHSYSAVHRLTAQSDLRQVEVKLTTISAGYFAFQVVGVRDLASGQLVDFSDLGPIALSPQAEASLYQIWPTFWRGVPWPPLQSLSHKDLIDLSEMWAKANDALEDPPR